ncbi:integral membrane protein [Colletotrichum plurivorum]|uniref:Integral membrane protein n=1 Tax=Colletotrichum plurivorum TaxID=2175906 RepID=A0A8H6N4Z7_9PEZI|nr:integral membrane protein [Colletotrichum plurivorum]
MHLLYKALLTSTTTTPTISLPFLPRDAGSADDVDGMDHSIGGIIVASVVPATAISTMFALSRLFVRGWIQKRVHFDDGILLAAVVSGWTSTATTLKAVSIGHGRHVALLNDMQKEAILHWTIMAFSFGIFALVLPKLAVVALINRLLQPKRAQRVFLWALGVFCGLALIGNVVGLYSQCSPVQDEMSFMTKACLGPDMAVEYSISTSAISAATNAYLAVYVALSIRKVHFARRKKIGLAISLVLGLVALFTAIFKCTRLKSLGSPDFTYDAADLVIWTSLEADVVIMAACIPAMQPLVDYLFPHPSDSSSSSITTPASPTSITPRKKLWSISHDPEAAREMYETELQISEMIMVEREFQINVTTSTQREWSPTTNPSAVKEDEKFRVMKDHGPDGVVTTTVVVMTSAPVDIARFPTGTQVPTGTQA